MDVDALRLLATLAGAVLVAGAAVGAALVGGPRRRPAMTLGVTGGRVRLASRALERIALIAVALTMGLVLWLVPVTTPAALAGLFAAACLAFAVRRGALVGLAAREAGPDDHVDDGYVDSGPGAGDG